MKKIVLLLAFLFATPAWAQLSNFQSTATNQTGIPIPGATITVCLATDPTPCTTNDIALYSDPAGANPLPPAGIGFPFVATGYGNYSFWAVPGNYNVTVSGNGLITTNSLVSLPCVIGSMCGGGGGVFGTGTTNRVTKWLNATTIGNSAGFDDSINSVQWPNGVNLMQNALYVYPANAVAGTTQFGVVKLVGNQAQAASNSDSEDVYGVATQGAGTSGNVAVAILGRVPCTFDNGPTAPQDWVILSTTTAPDCHDTGSVFPTAGVFNFGRVASVNGGAGTTALVDVYIPGALAAQTTSTFVPLCTYGVTPTTTDYTVQVSDACHDIDITGTTAAQTITLPQPGTSGISSFVGTTIATPTSGTTVSLTRTLTAGDMVFVVANSQSSTVAPFFGCSDDQGDTFTNVGSNMSMVVSLNTYSLLTGYFLNVSGGATVITCATASSASGLTMGAYEYSNVVAFDVTAQQNVGDTTDGQAITSPSVVTNSANELLVGASMNNCSPTGTGPGAGFVARSLDNSNFLENGALEDQIVGPLGGPYLANIVSSCTAGLTFSAQIATFRLNGLAGSYLNGFWVDIANHSNQDWTLSATSSDIIACDGSSAGTTTEAAGTGLLLESDGVNWRTALCGQAGGGSGSGTVTEVDTDAPLSGGPITTTGTLSCPTCTTNAASLTANELLIGGGSQATAVLGALGTVHTLLHGNAAGAPSFGAVALATEVSGTLPTTNLPFTYTTTNASTLLATFEGATTNGNCVAMNTNGNLVDNGAPCGTAGGGTVNSVGLALPVSVFTVSGSPVTTTGTLTGAFATQSANLVFAGPTTGSAATPTFRALVLADLPSGISASFTNITSGTNTTAAMVLGTGSSLTVSGTGTNVSTAMTPAGTLNNCVKWGSAGVLGDAGAPCGVSGINLTVNGGSNLGTPVNFQNGATVNGMTVNFSNPSSSNVQASVNGTLAIAGGGTSATTKAAAFDALSPTTTNGDLILRSGGTNARLAIGTNGQCLLVASLLPSWGACATGTISGSGTTNFIPIFTSATSLGTSPLSLSGGTITSTDPVSVPQLIISGVGQARYSGESSQGAIIFNGTASNTDSAGELTLAGGTVTYTWASIYASHPICNANDSTATNPVRVTYTGVASVTFLGTGTDVVDYTCVGRN